PFTAAQSMRKVSGSFSARLMPGTALGLLELHREHGLRGVRELAHGARLNGHAPGGGEGRPQPLPVRPRHHQGLALIERFQLEAAADAVQAAGAAADRLLALGDDDVVGDLLVVAVPGAAPDEEHAFLALHGHRIAGPIAAVDLELVSLGRALLDRDLRLLARLDEVAADGHAVFARAHELVAQGGLDLAVEGRLVHEALDD